MGPRQGHQEGCWHEDGEHGLLGIHQLQPYQSARSLPLGQPQAKRRVIPDMFDGSVREVSFWPTSPACTPGPSARALEPLFLFLLGGGKAFEGGMEVLWDRPKAGSARSGHPWQSGPRQSGGERAPGEGSPPPTAGSMTGFGSPPMASSISATQSPPPGLPDKHVLAHPNVNCHPIKN